MLRSIPGSVDSRQEPGSLSYLPKETIVGTDIANWIIVRRPAEQLAIRRAVLPICLHKATEIVGLWVCVGTRTARTMPRRRRSTHSLTQRNSGNHISTFSRPSAAAHLLPLVCTYNTFATLLTGLLCCARSCHHAFFLNIQGALLLHSPLAVCLKNLNIVDRLQVFPTRA